MASQKFTLEKRPEGWGPIFVGSYRPGDKIEQWPIAAGNQVALRSDGITVIADVSAVAAGNYKGVIVGFENYLEECLHGKCAGDTVDFRFEHVFGCSR